jgi:hypothetical protein
MSNLTVLHVSTYNYIYIYLYVTTCSSRCWKCPPSTLRHAWLWRKWNSGELYSKLPTIFIWFLSIMKVHCTWHVCYRQQTKLDWVTKMTQCTIHMPTDWQFVSHTVAMHIATHCRQFLDKNLKQYLTICPPVVKHVWELKEVNSSSQSNVQWVIFLYTLHEEI